VMSYIFSTKKYEDSGDFLIRTIGIILVGLFAGIMCGQLGVGGGFIFIAGMIHILNMPIKKAAGTSLVVIIPTALTGIWQHAALGNVNWTVALIICIASICGVYFGTWLNKHLSASIIRKIFAVVLLLIAINMWD